MTTPGCMVIGAKLPSFGAEVTEHGIPAMARRLEAAGFDSIWTSDHVVMVEGDASPYPYSDDGRPGWDTTTPWYDALIVMAQAAAVTERVEIGCAVLVLPQRHPVVLAKQMASLEVLSPRGVALGVGAGWYREEFEALGWDFATRGPRTDEWMALLRHCWSGSREPFHGAHHSLPGGVVHEPRPRRPIPLLVGGISTAALERAGRLGDGWLGLQRADRLDVGSVAAAVGRVQAVAHDAGRDPAALRFTVRVMRTDGRIGQVAAAMPALAAAGVDEVVVDVGWTDDGDAETVHEVLRDAA